MNQNTKPVVGGLTKPVNLLEGSVSKCLLLFAFPLFIGQLLQQLYNMADAWVIGQFADDNAFAAVSSAGNIIFLIVGLFNGISIGGGVIISKYFGAKDEENVVRAIHNNFLFAVVSSVASTVIGLLIVPKILEWMNTPPSVLPQSLTYFGIYFAGVSTVIMYNICMSIMRSLGDSIRPLYYLIVSSLTNILLDLLFVAVFHWGVAGAAIATVISQALSVVLCIIRMLRVDDYTRLDIKKMKFDKKILGEVIKQGLPTGIQNAVISIGNIAVQTNINSFGEFAMAGVGAYSKIEGLVFMPIMSMSMSLPTFVSQNLGAKNYSRAKKGTAFGIIFGILTAELLGVLIYNFAPSLLAVFVESPESMSFGQLHMRTTSLFYCLLALSHCVAGALRGLGKSFIPMATMLAFWCGVRVVYVNSILNYIPRFEMISWAYPLTWALSSIVLTIALLRSDWTKAFENKTT
ncbi:MAG: MATE family efflux transporter [Ruminococcaceae bacterium]|nr:MATE family efflux transporter [Oscillospiraceae bacterium]